MKNGSFRKRQLLLVCLMACSPTSLAQVSGAPGETLQIRQLPDAIHSAVLRHPTVPQAVARISEESERVEVARSAYRPQLRAGVDLGQGWESEQYRRYASVSVSQMVYDFGRTSNQVDRARARSEVQRANLLVQLDELIADVAEAYIEVLRHQALLELVGEHIDRINEIGQLARQRLALGAGNGSDAIQARSREESARSDQLALQTRLGRQRIILSSLIQAPVAESLTDDLASIESFGCSSADLSVTDSAEFLLAQAERNVALQQLEGEKLDRYPSISVEAGMRKPVFDNRFDSGANDFNVALKVSMDLYQGGRVSARSRAAEFGLRGSELNTDLARLRTLQQLDEADTQIRMLNGREQILQAQERSAAETRELYREQYVSLGTRSLIDLLNADQEQHMARYDRVNLRYEKAILNLECMSASGQLRDHFDINVDALARSAGSGSLL